MFFGTKAEAIQHLTEHYNDGDVIAFQIWAPEDVQSACECWSTPLTTAEAESVLETVADNHDCNLGVNWEVLQITADDYRREGEPDAV